MVVAPLAGSCRACNPMNRRKLNQRRRHSPSVLIATPRHSTKTRVLARKIRSLPIRFRRAIRRRSRKRMAHRAIDLPPPPAGTAIPAGAAANLRFIGNATLLLELCGVRILTDPNFLHAGDHAHIGYGMTTKRLLDPALSFEELPHVDAVVLSHYHGDHFDQDVEAKLRRDMPIVTTPHAAAILTRSGFTATCALPTWSSVDLRRASRKVSITALPGKHGPGLLSAALPQVMGSLLEFEPPDATQPVRVYLSGDTLVHDALYEIPKRFPDIDLAVLHLGGTRVFGVLLTLDGHGGITALRIINARVTMPVHFEEYTVMRSPLEDFMREVQHAGLSDRVRYVPRGATIDLATL